MPSPYQNTTFLLSAADIKQLPDDTGIEVAIVGRSNAGKSSVLNVLTQSKKLARVSKTPGRTQLINVFTIDEERRLIDLPGYGYAKVPDAAKAKWEKSIEKYFANRESLKGLVIVMDIRHPFKPLDDVLLDYCQDQGLKAHILLNKADKLSKGAAAKALQLCRNRSISLYGDKVSLQTFSAMKKDGVEKLHEVLNEWYEY